MRIAVSGHTPLVFITFLLLDCALTQQFKMKEASQKERLTSYFNEIAPHRDQWKSRHRSYHACIENQYSFIIPKGASVLEIGCGTGDLLNAVGPSHGVGVDFAGDMIAIAQKKFPHLTFICADALEYHPESQYDYIILSDLFCSLLDIQKTLGNLRHACTLRTKVIISNYNYLWEPIFKLAETMGLKQKQPLQNWLSYADIENILKLEGFDPFKMERRLLFPKQVPIIAPLFNKGLANLPLINHLDVYFLIVARLSKESNQEYSVSILVPARNERGNIENAILRTPSFGQSQQFIFVEGHSSDGTYEEIVRVQQKYKDRDIVAIRQTGKGKGNAVREGFERATGEVLMILDADLTMPPEDLPKFYEALAHNHGDFINGSRLVYPMEKQAMRFLNLLANKAFGLLFTFLLGQRLKDTLCGTKVLFKADYNRIVANRQYFGDFDPFGDFDLLFGASKLNLKIVEIPVRYRDREYGSTQISRFKHGWLLLKMCVFAAFKLKFR